MWGWPLWIVAGALLLTQPGAAARGTLVVGGEDGYEPFETLDEDGVPRGFNVDLMQAIAREIGVEVRFDLGPWGPRRRAIERGDIDVLGMFVSADRARSVSFARPHLIVYHRIFLPAGSDSPDGLESLRGRQVIVQRDAYSHEYLAASGLDLNLILVADDAEGLRLLASGQHDAAVLTEHRGRHVLDALGIDSLTVSGPPLLPVEYALAVPSKREDLLALIDDGLERVRASGEFDRIYRRWLGAARDGDTRESGGFQLSITIAVSVLLLAVVAFGMIRLRAVQRERTQAIEQLDFLRRHDALTGLLNRHALEAEMAALLDEAGSRTNAHALVTLNLDRFRIVNESLGHGWGDQVLREVATILRRALPGGAIAARLGDDEFALLLGDTSPRLVEAIGNEVREAVQRTDFGSAQRSVSLTASVGIVLFRGDEGVGMTELIGRADSALVAAKEAGGNGIHVWKHDDARLAERRGELRWVSRIESALADGRMDAWWQPIVPSAASTSGLLACEFLARMHSESGEVIAAGAFMPAAERYALSPRIDAFMLDRVLDWMRGAPKAVERLQRCFINMSGRSLGDARTLEDIEQRLLAAGPLIRKVCIEITETALIANLDVARAVLERLVERGCAFALDDFGMGLSSMAYLKRLPVTYLKIDGSFVRDIDRDDEARRMVTQIHRLGQAMGKITIAEFVESVAIRRILDGIGVDMVQGYGIGRPRPIDELARWCETTSGADALPDPAR